MGGPPLLGLLVLSSFLLSCSSVVLADRSGGSTTDGSSGLKLGWQILTERNFSSQIRIHPRILLMVTVPWSGEARSLMKEVAHLVASNEELSFLKLMVIYKSYEKMLADVLGATEEITLICYHNSLPHIYHGKLRARNIFSSIHHFLALKPEEVPVKALQTREDLESFFRSTDKAVLLLDFCGWSAKLLRRKNNGNYESPMTSHNHSENAGSSGLNIARKMTENFHMQHHQGEEDQFTCGVEDGLGSTEWLREYTLANQSAPEQLENGVDDARMPCAIQEFKQFEAFFTKFTSVAREFFLPPERQRFGLISEHSLLSFLGVTSENKWLVMLHFSGCSNCTMIVQEGDDLRKILQTHQSLVIEFDVDRHNLEPAFPANRPSIILFIDRFSDSLEVREESKSSLENLRKFASENQLVAYQTPGAQDGRNMGISSREAFLRGWKRNLPGSSSQQTGQVSPTIVKVQDNVAFMVVKEGQTISLESTTLKNEGNSVYDILTGLFQGEKPAQKTKEMRISEVAKKAGFELLSDDFEVQIIESFNNDNNKFSEMPIMEVTMPNEPKHLTEGYGALNDELTDTVENTAAHEGKQSDPPDTVAYILEPEAVAHGQDEKAKPVTASFIESEAGKFNSKEKLVPEDNRSYEQEETGSSYNNQHFVGLESELCNPEEYLQQDQADKIDSKSGTTYSSHGRSDLHSSLVFSSGDDGASSGSSMSVGKDDEIGYKHQPFLGSFFFVDGNYQLLRTLTTDSRIPSLVILDPVQERHFVLSQEMNISYLSIVSFVDKFLNNNLSPFERSVLCTKSSREMPKPPFLNLDFHEVDYIPQVVSSTFCELVMGFRPCASRTIVPFSNPQDLQSAWNIDVLVLFSNSWCGFCQRMELIVRELYRAFKNFTNSSLSQSNIVDSMEIKDKKDDVVLNKFPAIFLMDCTLNDCGLFLKQLGKMETYPIFLLFPAENKSAVTYDGDMSVVSIMEFLVSHGRSSKNLNKLKGLLWTHSKNVRWHEPVLHTASVTHSAEDGDNEFILDKSIAAGSNPPLEGDTVVASHDKYKHVAVGSILAATDEFLNAIPFDNSTVLIVSVDRDQGFQGLIINKRINWDIFKDLDSDLVSLKQAPLFYGGPVRLQKLPLVSLSRKSKVGYTKITKGVYFCNPMITVQVIKEIRSGEESAEDYWFFLGLSSWGYEQLFNEFASGAWHLSTYPIEHLDWPES